MKRVIPLFCLFLICYCADDEREPKFFFGPKMQTVVSYKRVPEFITEFMPSSCIVIEQTLPPCRHVRSLEIYSSLPTRIAKTQTPQIQNPEPGENANWSPVVQVRSSEASHRPTPPLNVKPQQIKNPSPHWNWNLFNIFRVENITYTTTKTEYITTRIEDPNTVVSFYVKGCRPSKLPFNLPECVRSREIKQENNIVAMAPLKFIPGNDLAALVPSKSENVTKIKEENVKENKTAVESN